jgi:hypothetical protein
VKQGLFDEAHLWDTEGKMPTLVATVNGTHLVVNDIVKWKSFLVKAKVDAVTASNRASAHGLTAAEAFDETQHPRDQEGRFTSSGRAIGTVVRETDKGILLKHGDKEGWLQKRWTQKEDNGETSFDPKHLEKFQPTHVTIKPEILKETDKAILIRHDDAEGWIPKSQIERLPDGSVKMPRWCADKLQATHEWVEADSVGESSSGKAYQLSVPVARPDGEPESATIFLPKSQVTDHSLPTEPSGNHRLRIPAWLKAEKEAEYEASHSGGGFTFHLLW